MLKLKLDEIEYSKPIAEKLVMILEVKWNQIANDLFKHINEKGCNYDPEFTDTHFAALAVYYQTVKGICTIVEAPFTLPLLEEVDFVTKARAGDRFYLQGIKGT
jgi:hypothetical protein